MKQLLLTWLIMLITILAQAQVGGAKSFEFLNAPYTARISGLGGVNVSTADRDVNMFFSNPALVGESLSGNIGFNYVDYLADVNLGSVAYAHQLTNFGTVSGGVQYFALGSIETYDASGNTTGTAQSGELNVNAAFAHQISNFRLGVGTKWANSTIANYTANALLFDLGGVFIHPEKDLNIALVIKNFGFIINEYSETSSSKFPFDVQLGITYKPEHMPFRLSLTGYNLTKRDVTYYEPNDNVSADEPSGFDKVLSHFVIGTEIVFSENVNLRIGYNHLLRQSLRLEERGGISGISFGLMFKIKKIEFAYSHGGYHVAGGINNFTIATNIGRFMGNKKTNSDD